MELPNRLFCACYCNCVFLTHWGLVTPYGDWSWTTLAQVMACCLTAPSHYLNQCWLITRGVLWHTSESSFAGIAQGIDSGYEFEKDILKNIFKSPRGQWVNFKLVPIWKCMYAIFQTDLIGYRYKHLSDIDISIYLLSFNLHHPGISSIDMKLGLSCVPWKWIARAMFSGLGTIRHADIFI